MNTDSHRFLSAFISVNPREALDLLARGGMGPASVPAAGEYIRLRRRDNINAGGENRPCALGDVHPANLQLAVDAAMALRLDLAGVGLIIEDVSRSWLEAGGAIREVNGQPQMGGNSHAGVLDAASLIERKPRTRRLRLGVRELEILPLDAAPTQPQRL